MSSDRKSTGGAGPELTPSATEQKKRAAEWAERMEKLKQQRLEEERLESLRQSEGETAAPVKDEPEDQEKSNNNREKEQRRSSRRKSLLPADELPSDGESVISATKGKASKDKDRRASLPAVPLTLAALEERDREREPAVKTKKPLRAKRRASLDDNVSTTSVESKASQRSAKRRASLRTASASATARQLEQIREDEERESENEKESEKEDAVKEEIKEEKKKEEETEKEKEKEERETESELVLSVSHSQVETFSLTQTESEPAAVPLPLRASSPFSSPTHASTAVYVSPMRERVTPQKVFSVCEQVSESFVVSECSPAPLLVSAPVSVCVSVSTVVCEQSVSVPPLPALVVPQDSLSTERETERETDYQEDEAEKEKNAAESVAYTQWALELALGLIVGFGALAGLCVDFPTWLLIISLAVTVGMLRRAKQILMPSEQENEDEE